MRQWNKWCWMVVAALPSVALAQVDVAALGRGMTGPRAQVLVLGTVHLRSLPPDFNRAALDGLLDRLAAFKPEIITIEAEAGEECDSAARHVAKYGANFCASTAAALAATGLDLPAAMTEADKTLKAWRAQPTPAPAPAQRRHLAAVFLAANDPASAYVQWLQLPEAERHAGDGLDAALVEQIGKVAKRNNEDYLIAAPLAARLGLQRVVPVDNHSGDNLDVPDTKALVSALEAAWAVNGAAGKARRLVEKPLLQAPDLLPLYRYINTPEGLQVQAQANVNPAMLAKSADGYPQMWVAGWEIRNMRMVANIRETFRERPGARVLTIVGVSHKPWFDAWLGRLQGIDIVDVETVLK